MPSRLETAVHLAKTSTNCLIADQQSRVAVVVTHPWGPLGGNMHNNVVTAAVLYFQKLGLTTARFDFNGGIGRGYVQVNQVLDVVQALRDGTATTTTTEATVSGTSDDNNNNHANHHQDIIHRRDPHIKPSHFILVGYSYGSLITGSASADLGDDDDDDDGCILACISIAPPFAVSHWLLCFNSSYHLKRATTVHPALPRLLLIGTEDNFTSQQAFKDTVETKYPANVTTGAVIKGADHFFRRREKDVMDVIGQWILETFSAWCQGDLRNLRDLEMTTSSAASSQS